ncbi:MAG: hypothetical protein K2Y05_01275 [Hyphomicrobiaceae bacterium]|nr:hypothetical protein [Hyphomicrobiaceae bacterium]
MIPGCHEKLAVAIEDGPDAMRVDAGGQLLSVPPQGFVGAVDRLEPALECRPAAGARALLERDDNLDLLAALPEFALVELVLSDAFGIAQRIRVYCAVPFALVLTMTS